MGVDGAGGPGLGIEFWCVGGGVMYLHRVCCVVRVMWRRERRGVVNRVSRAWAVVGGAGLGSCGFIMIPQHHSLVLGDCGYQVTCLPGEAVF